MRNRYKIGIILTVLLTAGLFSCQSEGACEFPEKDTKLDIFIQTSAETDALVMGGDGSFSSLALYIFNAEDGYCEYSEIIPEFTPAEQEWTRSVLVSSKTKVIYAIANYDDPQKEFSTIINASTTMDQLEALTVQNPDFSGNSILMVGKKEVIMDSQQVSVDLPMQRLVARLDVYIYKSNEITDQEVVVKSVEFINQVLNSNARYKDFSMLDPIEKQTATTTITENGTLNEVPTSSAEVTPDQIRASWYSYQNISASARPDVNINPHLRITVDIDGVETIYTGHIESFIQPEGRFSLVRNKVYRVFAVLGGSGGGIILSTTIFPWEVTSSDLGHVLKDTDYTFEALNNDSEALNGIVQYPYVDSKGPHNSTSFANYSFRLTAPEGAVWTASLTNGLDFYFGTGGSLPGKKAVSQGITRTEPYEIKVGAAKPWHGVDHQTYLYITVDGVKLKINPRVNGSRKFPGDNDTDILISQTEYKE